MSLFTKTVNEFKGVQAKPVIASINEEAFGDTVDSWYAYAERRLKGYSVTEIDVLAKKAKSIDSEVKKRDTLSRIDAAITDAKASLAKDGKNEEKAKELRLQLTVLAQLKTKVNAFKVVDDSEGDKGKDDEDSRSDKIDLDGY